MDVIANYCLGDLDDPIQAEVFLQNYVDKSNDLHFIRYATSCVLFKRFAAFCPIKWNRLLPMTSFDRALVLTLEGKKVFIEELTFLEKLFILSIALIFGNFDELFMKRMISDLIQCHGDMGLFLLTEVEARSNACSILAGALLGIKTANPDLDNDLDLLALAIAAQEVRAPVESSLEEGRVISYQHSNIKSCFCFEGKGSGIGACFFEKIKVVNFGPQVLDIAEMEKYGIDYHSESGVFGLIEQSQGEFCCRGWSRLLGDRDVWIEHEIRIQEDRLDVFVAIERIHSSKEFAECFFVVCDSVQVDQKNVKQGSLERYRGFTKALELEKEGECVNISLENDVICQVIPLAGENHFWGANFLISFEPREDTTRMHFQFVKSSL